jgi:Skp family chaperone for outer membrane proteins
MPKVMLNYEKAKYFVVRLNEKRLALSSDVVKWRSEYIAIQMQQSDTDDATMKETFSKQLVELSRKIEDKGRDITNILNDDATQIITLLYEEIKSVVDKIAEKNRYQIVFAYPDVTAPEDQKNPFFMELKVKPKAALPIGVVPDIDITPVVIAHLNEQFPPPEGPQK